AAVKHSALLADFLSLVVREQYRIFADKLTYQMWDDFIADCQNRDAELPEWSESTVNRLRSSVFQILQQAGYIDSTKSLRLQTVHIADEVVRYLDNNDEGSVLRCIQITP
ncbi:MAG: BrxA family protein, partial [Planctomycetales bacterium]